MSNEWEKSKVKNEDGFPYFSPLFLFTVFPIIHYPFILLTTDY